MTITVVHKTTGRFESFMDIVAIEQVSSTKIRLRTITGGYIVVSGISGFSTISTERNLTLDQRVNPYAERGYIGPKGLGD